MNEVKEEKTKPRRIALYLLDVCTACYTTFKFFCQVFPGCCPNMDRTSVKDTDIIVEPESTKMQRRQAYDGLSITTSEEGHLHWH